MKRFFSKIIPKLPVMIIPAKNSRTPFLYCSKNLLVRTEGEKKGVLARIRMISRLKLCLGEQKIDLIGDHEENSVVREALKNGMQLI